MFVENKLDRIYRINRMSQSKQCPTNFSLSLLSGWSISNDNDKLKFVGHCAICFTLKLIL